MSKLRLAVIFGGRNQEHEVSVNSANQVMAALDKNKYQIIPIKISKNGQWLALSASKRLSINIIEGSQDLNKKKIDLVLPLIHGPFGEDGKLQGMLEKQGLPYVFSGVEASALSMDKFKTKLVAKKCGLSVAEDLILRREKPNEPAKIVKSLGLPVVIKPNELGSSVGISIAKNLAQLEKGIKEAFKYDRQVMVEKFIKGRELTVAVMGNKNPKALPVIEIIPRVSNFFDYRAKYELGGSQEICPAKIPNQIKNLVQKESIVIFQALRCRDLARADFIWPEPENEVYFIEINTIPGMTKTSLVPKAAKAAEMDFSKFLDKLINLAIERI